MKNIARFPKTLDLVVTGGLVLAGIAGTALPAAAQNIQDIRTPKSPLVLSAQGSFFVGGETVFSDALVGVSSGFPTSGDIQIHQMYVRFMIPKGSKGTPVVFTAGGGLSGKLYETTPDGRMGWDEYFVRNKHPVYIDDQVARGRSRFNQTPFNKVLNGSAPPSSQPNMVGISNEFLWSLYRFGPTLGTPFPGTQFPVEAAIQFMNAQVTDISAGVPSPHPTIKLLSDLVVELEGAVLVGHSQSGRWQLDAALINPQGVKGAVLLEPGGGCPASYTDQEIAKLATIPILVVYGDFIEGSIFEPGLANCRVFIDRVNAARGKAQVIHLPEVGILGNSHAMMQDKNNLQVADVILKWIKTDVEGKETASR